MRGRRRHGHDAPPKDKDLAAIWYELRASRKETNTRLDRLLVILGTLEGLVLAMLSGRLG